jgi:hypothetical protein
MSKEKPTFSRGRKWGIGFQVGFIVCVVFSIVVMLNYLSGAYFHRFHWSSARQVELSPRTIRYIQSLTNQVKVTMYYDRNEPFFSMVQGLLKEYHNVNSRISIESVDYLRDAIAAQRIKSQYKQLIFPTSTNLVIFESGGRALPLDGNALTIYAEEQVPDAQQWAFQRRAVAFQGEKMFTSALLAVCSGKPLIAYFLEGHGENAITSSDTNNGYTTFAAVAQQNFIKTEELHSLLGSNSVPPDCNLLVIPGPNKPLQDVELAKIDRYLNEGGRLMVLFNHDSAGKKTGLENLLKKWGVEVRDEIVRDRQHSTDPEKANDLITTTLTPHPAVNALYARNWRLMFYEPRCVRRLPTKQPAADGIKVDEIVYTSSDAFVDGEEAARHGNYPLMVAVEKGDTKGIVAGATRILVVGDSTFLGNQPIEMEANRDFAEFALNWLVDRAQLLDGVAARPIEHPRLLMTATDRAKAEWVLLGGMPGAALLVGGVVWLRRRK